MIIKQQEKMQVSFQELLFYGYFGLMLLIKGLGYADGPVYKAGILLALILAAGKILTTAYTATEWGVVVLLSGLAVINRMITGLDSMLFVIPLILSMKKIPVKRVMHLGAIGWSVTFFFQVVTHLTGLRSFDFVVHNKFGLGYVIRWAMGYVHPNVLQISYNVLVFYLIYSCCKSRRDFQRAFWLSLAGAVYLFLYSLSITGMLMYAAFWLFLGIEYLIPKQSFLSKRVWMNLTMLLLPAEAFLSIALPLFLKGKAFDWIEKLMTHRPSLTRFFFTTYGFSFLGNNPGGLISNYTLDCSYANLLFHGGILLFAIAMVGYFFLIRREALVFSEKRSAETGVELAITLACLAGAVSEPFAFNTSFKNISLIFMGSFLFGESQGKREYGLFPFLQSWLNQKGWNSFSGVNLWNVLKCSADVIIQNLRSHWKEAVLVGVIFAVAGTCAYDKTADRVQGYYSCRINTDAGEEQKDSLYISEEEAESLRNDSSVRVLSYRDSDTQMVFFDGTIGRVEFARGLMSAAVWSFGAGGILTVVIVMWQTKTQREKKNAK